MEVLTFHRGTCVLQFKCLNQGFRSTNVLSLVSRLLLYALISTKLDLDNVCLLGIKDLQVNC